MKESPFTTVDMFGMLGVLKENHELDYQSMPLIDDFQNFNLMEELGSIAQTALTSMTMENANSQVDYSQLQKDFSQFQPDSTQVEMNVFNSNAMDQTGFSDFPPRPEEFSPTTTDSRPNSSMSNGSPSMMCLTPSPCMSTTEVSLYSPEKSDSTPSTETDESDHSAKNTRKSGVKRNPKRNPKRKSRRRYQSTSSTSDLSDDESDNGE